MQQDYLTPTIYNSGYFFSTITIENWCSRRCVCREADEQARQHVAAIPAPTQETVRLWLPPATTSMSLSQKWIQDNISYKTVKVATHNILLDDRIKRLRYLKTSQSSKTGLAFKVLDINQTLSSTLVSRVNFSSKPVSGEGVLSARERRLELLLFLAAIFEAKYSCRLMVLVTCRASERNGSSPPSPSMSELTRDTHYRKKVT